MSRTERLALLPAVALAAVVLLLVAACGGEEPAAPVSTTEITSAASVVTAETAATTEVAETGAAGTTAGTVSSPTVTSEPPGTVEAPQPIRVRVEGGEPVGGAAEIDVKNGDVVRLVVTSDVVDEVHIHGYDISKPVAPRQQASFEFTADIEGVFEIELEERAVEIASLTVQPK